MTEEVIVKETLTLPASIVTLRDLARLVEEAEELDNELTTTTVRAHVSQGVPEQPIVTAAFADFLAENHLEFNESKAREQLVKQLRALKDEVPVVHMTFAVPADNESLQQLASWVRQSLHKQAVLEIGLQQALVAGVYVRTTNRIHDLSMRTALKGKRDILLKDLEAFRAGV